MHPREGTRLHLLDGLRGLAAIGVLFYHSEITQNGGVFSRGYLFVDLFFLISGFVLTLAFEDRLASDAKSWPFLKSRYRRFCPLAIMGAALGVMAFHSAVGGWLAAGAFFLFAATMVPMPAPGMLFPLNAPQWSLLYELAANWAHARWLCRLSSAKILVIAGIFGSALIVLLALTGADADKGANGAEMAIAALRAGWSYPLGIVMARHWRRYQPRSLVDWRAALALPVVTVVLLPSMPLPLWLGDLITIILMMPCLFWLAATARPPFAATPLLKNLGGLSFPIYALHFPLLVLGAAIVPGAVWRYAAVPAVILCALAADRLRGIVRKPAPARQTSSPVFSAPPAAP